jgi:hypothetical protein
MDDSAPSLRSKAYDLYFVAGERRLVWKIADHGVTLERDAIAWTQDGQESRARFKEIAEVHLQTGAIGQQTIATCRLRFSDGSILRISSSNSEGVEDDTQAGLYSEFVHDLHGRLAVLKGASIVFSAGFSEARYNFGKVLLVVAALFFVALPGLAALITGQLKAISLLFGGVFLAWPLYKVVEANAPRNYDPSDIPEELVQTQSGGANWLSWIRN